MIENAKLQKTQDPESSPCFAANCEMKLVMEPPARSHIFLWEHGI